MLRIIINFFMLIKSIINRDSSNICNNEIVVNV